jgi:hypothetical protein
MSTQREEICELLSHTMLAYIKHREDDLEIPVLGEDLYWGILDYCILVLATAGVKEPNPAELIDQVMEQIRERTMLMIESLKKREMSEGEMDGV